MKLSIYSILIIVYISFYYAEANDRVFTFGVVPQQASSVLAKAWNPILKEIGDRSGIKLKFATATNIPTFESRLKQGLYDFAYMNPYTLLFTTRSQATKL